MADSDDDVVDAIDRLKTVEEFGNTIRGLTALHQIQQARQAAQSRAAAQQAEAARAEQIYLGAHCPCCHTSLTGTPAVCAACTRDIAWLRLPLDATVLELISGNLHTFKEVYRDLLGASVVFDKNQKVVHVPLSSRHEIGEAKDTLRTLDEKLVAYRNFFTSVVEKRKAVIARCPKCQSVVFERALVPSKKGNDRVCPPCSIRAPDESGSGASLGTCLCVVGAGLSVLLLIQSGNDANPDYPFSTFTLVGIWSLGIGSLIGLARAVNRFGLQTEQEQVLSDERSKLVAAAKIPADWLVFHTKTMNGLVNLIDLRTKSLEEFLKRIDEAALPKRIASESGDAGSEFANQFESAAQDSAPPIPLPSKTSLRQLAVSRVALTAAKAEFTAIEKQKPLTADSTMIRAVALAMVAMKTVDVATVRTCTDRLARKLIEITPDELLESVQIVGRGVQEAKLQNAFEQVCDSLRAEPEFAKARHRVVAEVIAELLPEDTGETTKKANGPKVIRALCKVLNS